MALPSRSSGTTIDFDGAKRGSRRGRCHATRLTAFRNSARRLPRSGFGGNGADRYSRCDRRDRAHPGKSNGKKPRRGRDLGQAERLRALSEVDALLDGWSCEDQHGLLPLRGDGPRAVPYRHRAVRSSSARSACAEVYPKRRTLPGCRRAARAPLLSGRGRCASSMRRARSAAEPSSANAPPSPRAKAYAQRPEQAARLGRAVADLSARFAPVDPGPRPLLKATSSWRR